MLLWFAADTPTVRPPVNHREQQQPAHGSGCGRRASWRAALSAPLFARAAERAASPSAFRLRAGRRSGVPSPQSPAAAARGPGVSSRGNPSTRKVHSGRLGAGGRVRGGPRSCSAGARGGLSGSEDPSDRGLPKGVFARECQSGPPVRWGAPGPSRCAPARAATLFLL